MPPSFTDVLDGFFLVGNWHCLFSTAVFLTELQLEKRKRKEKNNAILK